MSREYLHCADTRFSSVPCGQKKDQVSMLVASYLLRYSYMTSALIRCAVCVHFKNFADLEDVYGLTRSMGHWCCIPLCEVGACVRLCVCACVVRRKYQRFRCARFAFGSSDHIEREVYPSKCDALESMQWYDAMV